MVHRTDETHAMAAEKSTAYKPHVRELATRIYVSLVSGAVSVTENSVKMTASAQNLAKLSFQLAESFQTVEDELNSANLPKNTGFKLEAADIASWTK
jgi:hypothetical protein